MEYEGPVSFVRRESKQVLGGKVSTDRGGKRV